MSLEGARELGVVTEAETIGDLGDRQTIGGIAQLGVTGVEPLVPYPLADRLVGVAKELVQIARGDAAGARDQVRIEIDPAEIAARKAFDAAQMRLPDSRGPGSKRAFIRLDGEHEKIDQMTTDHQPRFGRHRIEASRNQAQHVGEQAARTVPGVELYAAEAIGRADAAAQGLGVDLDDPHFGEFGVAELIGLVTAFEEEAAGPAADLLASLREDDF